MAKYLIVYGTKEGQTAKIANRMSQIIKERGYQVDLHDARQVPKTLKLEDYGGILIGSSMHMLQWSKDVTRFARWNSAVLNKNPSAFFSVSMTMASKTPEERAKLTPYVDKFFAKTGWHPKTVGNFAGSFAYSKYGYFTKWLMVRIARSKGETEKTDTSKDIEYTDWE